MLYLHRKVTSSLPQARHPGLLGCVDAIRPLPSLGASVPQQGVCGMLGLRPAPSSRRQRGCPTTDNRVTHWGSSSSIRIPFLFRALQSVAGSFLPRPCCCSCRIPACLIPRHGYWAVHGTGVQRESAVRQCDFESTGSLAPKRATSSYCFWHESSQRQHRAEHRRGLRCPTSVPCFMR